MVRDLWGSIGLSYHPSSLSGRVLTILLALIMLGSISCSKKSTKPEPTDSSIIVVDRGVSRSIYFIDPDSNEVVDSIPRVGLVYQGAISPDGRALFLATEYEGADPQGIYKYDVQSKTQVGYLAISVDFVFVEGGRTIVAAGIDSLFLIDTDKFEITEARPLPFWSVYGRPDANFVVGPTASSPPATSNRLSIYDLATQDSDTITVDEIFHVRQCFLHPDRRRVFVIGFLGDHARLFVVDLQTKESREIFQLRSFVSRITFSDNGDTAYLINSEDLDNPDLIGCGMGEIVRLNTADEDYAVLERIETDAPLLSVALSPSGDKLYVGQTLNFCGDGGNVLAYDTGDLTLPPDTITLPRKQSGPIEILVIP